MRSSRNSATASVSNAAPQQRAPSIERRDSFTCATFHAMGSPCDLLVATVEQEPATELAGIAAREAWRIERKFSRYVEDNIVARINSANGTAVQVDEETADLIDFAATLYDISENRFDITSGVLREAWTFDGVSTCPTKT